MKCLRLNSIFDRLKPTQLFVLVGFLLFAASPYASAGNGDPNQLPVPVVRIKGAAVNSSVSLYQYRNGAFDDPDNSCTHWVHGNDGVQQSHFVEGWSVPYRAVMEDLPLNTSITLTIGYDIKHNGHHALDYLTHYDYMLPHNICGHNGMPECLDPTADVTGLSGTTTTFPIPAPSSAGSPVFGQPTTSFNNHPATYMTLFGGTITNIVYNTEGDLNLAQSETTIDVTFTVDASTAVLAWGGHIASRLDWGYDGNGDPRSAGGISGSPYHMRLNDWTLGNIGNEDRSLRGASPVIACDMTGPLTVCPNSTSEYCVTDETGQTYAWSVASGDATIVGSTTGACVSVQAGTGDFTLQVNITTPGQDGLCFECSSSIDVLQTSTECSITGSDAVCPGASTEYCAPAGGTDYQWSITGGGTISGSSTGQCVTVIADNACGSYTVSVEYSDNGCAASCSMEASVEDSENPQISCPDGFTVQCLDDVPACSSADASATDNCDLNISISCMQGDLEGGACGGTVTNTYVAEDDCGNTDICTQVITVNDDTDPEITCPASYSVQCVSDVPACDASEASATDNCDQSLSLTCSQGELEGTACNGTITNTYVAEDDCGNTDACTQVITIHDDTDPEFTTCPAGFSVQCAADVPACNAADAAASDNCDANVTITCSQGQLVGGACGGTVTNTYTAEDDCGNTAVCQQVITVNDNTQPSISCPPQKDLLCNESRDPSNTGYPTANDNCDASLTIGYSDDPNSSSCGSEQGASFVRTWTAEDDCGNTKDCQQTITCGPCVIVCALTQGFYGSTSGQFNYNGTNMTALQMITKALTDYGPMVLGNPSGPGGSLTVPASAAACLNSLMPGGGTAKIFPDDRVMGGSGCLPAAWKKNGKLNSVLWGQAAALWINVKLFPKFCNLKLANACIQKPAFIPSSVVTVCDLLTYTSNVLADNPHLSNGDLGLLAGYIGDLHVYFDECELACGLYYAPTFTQNNESRENEPTVEAIGQEDFKVAPNPMSDNFTITLNEAQLGKSVLVKVVNQVGEVVLTEKYSTLANDQIHLTTRSLQAGVYQVVVMVGNQRPMSKTIVVMKP